MIPIDLTGKTAFITGSSQGIGEVTARRLHEAGANVAINFFADEQGHNEKNALAIANELGNRAIAVAADVRNRDQLDEAVAAIIEKFASLDIVINNAGIIRDHTLKRMRDDEWQDVIDINLTGVFNVCKVIEPHLADGGRIVSLSSVSAYLGAYGQLNYVAAKGGIVAMTRTLSRELAKRNITVNAIAPGLVDTDMTDTIPDDIKRLMIEQIPFARSANPREIADLILFLSSDLASYITGQTIHINGGWYT